MFKRKFNLIISIIALICAWTGVAFAGTPQAASDALSAFGLRDGQTDDAVVTRAELAEIAVKIMRGTEYVPAAQNMFTDVSDEDPAAGYMNAAVQSGLMAAENNTFRPAEHISVFDAACVLTRISGHAYWIERQGGYPGGYRYVINQYRLLRGIADDSEKLDYADLNTLFLNFLEMPYGKNLETYEDSIPVYRVDKEKTVLTEIFKMKKVEGIVFGNSRTTLNGLNLRRDDAFQIGDALFADKTMQYQDLLGYFVNAYVTDDDALDIQNVVYAAADPKNTNVVTVDAEDIEETVCSTELYKYYKDKRLKSIRIDERADVIYNGAALIPWTIDDICPKYGTVTFLDNNNDNQYDVIVVEESVNYFVESAGNVTKVIKDQYGLPDLQVDPDDEDLVYSIRYFDKEITLSDIAENNILTVRASKNKTGKRIIDIQVSTDFVEGKLTGITDDWITVGTQTYKYDERIKPYLDKITEGRFYLDCSGVIAGLHNEFMGGADAKDRYAYFYKAAIVSEAEEFVYVHLVDLNGKVLKLRAAENVRLIDGSSPVKLRAEDVFFGHYFANDGGFRPQLVMYSTNNAGELNMVQVARDGRADTKRDTNKFSLDLVLGDDYWYSYWNQLLSYNITQTDINTCYVSEDTNIIMLPRSIFDGQVDEEDVKVISRNKLAMNYDGIDMGYENGKMYYSDAEIYDCDELNLASVIVLFRDTNEDPDKGGAWNENTDVFVVSSVNAQLDEDGNMYYCLTGSIGLSSDAVMYTTEDTTPIMENAKPGDIYRIARDDSWRYITLARRVFSLKSDEKNVLTPEEIGFLSFGNSNKDKPYCRVSMIVGDVTSSRDGVLTVEGGYDSGKQTYFIQSYSNIIIMDTNRNGVQVSFGTTADITAGARVFLNTREHIIRDIVLFRK